MPVLDEGIDRHICTDRHQGRIDQHVAALLFEKAVPAGETQFHVNAAQVNSMMDITCSDVVGPSCIQFHIPRLPVRLARREINLIWNSVNDCLET